MESIFSHGLFANVVAVYGAIAEIAIAAFIIYLPAFHRPTAFQTATLRPLLWTPHFAFGLYIFVYNEGVKWCIRNRPNSWIGTHLGW